MTVNHIDEILALCDRVFGPDDNSPVPTVAKMTTRAPLDARGCTQDEMDVLLYGRVLPDPWRGNPRPSGTGGATTVHNLTFDAAKRLAARGGGRLCNNTRVTTYDDGFGVTLHQTEIFRYYAHINSAELYTGGYHTVTTKQRLNALLRQHGYHVYAVKREWYINNSDGGRGFEEGLCVALS